MISAIVLGAGVSSRLGRAKQLLPFGEKTVIERVVDNLLLSDIEELVVVLGHRAEEVAGLLVNKEVITVYNPDYKMGQSTSLIAGLESIEQAATGILCMLGDQPLVKSETINQLISHFKQSEQLIVAPKYQGQLGNPIIFATQLKSEMLMASGDQGARWLLSKYRDRLKEIEVEDRGVILDIDTEADYRKLLSILTVDKV
ncbi:molybdenum cofactor cytidylyltransferase [Fuchsiella alkaliacetigena]|uniref:molybdenum cofactor cytidylyltransferase n=1 Tax=Fuchsiella alkaliacetigena TaxID=957042 RepID=UPI00200A3407|nr:molybdenum cofactor cytidylyltransferase [Fuchsiella alkaliacetigena]MCK8825486.1 molybdenum cofactor cytidylyltransferase [Fuchsiella alkaliacetigena]